MVLLLFLCPCELADFIHSFFINRYLGMIKLGMIPLQCLVCTGLNIGIEEQWTEASSSLQPSSVACGCRLIGPGVREGC